MKKYPEYTNSGIEWIGEIPNHWHSKRLKYSTELIVSNVDKKTNENEIKVRLCNYSDVYKNDIIKESLDFMVGSANDKEFERFKLINGDVIITKDSESPDDIAIPAYVPKDFSDTVCGYHLAIIRQTGKISGKYLFYLFKSYKFNQQFTIAARGITRFGLSYASIANAYVSVPTTTEQTTIANFLDHKTQLIDNLIAKKEKLIELLHEERTAIINQAVTKGLDPNVPMKESGIEWLGEIPEHWGISKLKYFTKVISKGTTPSTIGKDLSDKGQIKFIKAENIYENYLQDAPLFFIDEDTHALLNRSQLQEGDILLVIAGATIGKAAIMEEEYIPANTNQAVCFIRLVERSYIKFVWYWLQSDYIKEFTKLSATQAAQPNLSMEDIGNFYLPKINLNELNSIIEYINSSTRRISETISILIKEIELFSEYKISLINEAVTGKIDVQDFKYAKNIN